MAKRCLFCDGFVSCRSKYPYLHNKCEDKFFDQIEHEYIERYKGYGITYFF